MDIGFSEKSRLAFSENYLLSFLEFSENANLLFSEKPISIVPLEQIL